jgi:hypothetical protein
MFFLIKIFFILDFVIILFNFENFLVADWQTEERSDQNFSSEPHKTK